MEPAASISGCLTDAATGLPIVDVEVIAYRREVFPFVYADTANAAKTGSDGCYRIDYLPAGNTLRLRSVNVAGYVDQVFDRIDCLGGACELFAGQTFAIAHDQDLSGINMALVQGASISGTVVSQTGVLPEDLRFNLYDSQGMQVRRSDGNLPIAGDGRFQSYGLADGVYFLAARADARLFVHGAVPTDEIPFPILDGTPITIANGQSVDGVNFELLGIQLLADGFESP